MGRLAGVIIALVMVSFICGLSVNINSRPATAAPQETPATDMPAITPVVITPAGGSVSASSYLWYSDSNNYPAGAVVDGRSEERDNCVSGSPAGLSYWLLANGRTGWVQIDLGQEQKIVKLRWLNTHNGPCQDRATTRYHIVVSKTGEFAGEEEQLTAGKMEMEIPTKFREYAPPKPVRARYVRFFVDEYFGYGGGLNELEVYVQAH